MQPGEWCSGRCLAETPKLREFDFAGTSWHNRRQHHCFHEDGEEGLGPDGGTGIVVSSDAESGTVTVLWDHGTVQTYAVVKNGQPLHLLKCVERHHSQRSVVLLRSCLRLLERSLKQAAQEASWGQMRTPHSVNVQPGEAHMAPFISPSSVASPRIEWHARVAACASPRDFKALVSALEESFLPSAVALPWAASLRAVWARFDPLHRTQYDEPGAPSILRRLAAWLHGLSFAFSAPMFVPEWDIQALPAFNAAIHMIGKAHTGRP